MARVKVEIYFDKETFHNEFFVNLKHCGVNFRNKQILKICIDLMDDLTHSRYKKNC